MSTHNIGFYEDLTKIIFELSSNTHLISSADHIAWMHTLICTIVVDKGIKLVSSIIGTDGEGADRPKRRVNRRFQRRRRQPRRDRDSVGDGEGDSKREDGSDKEGT